MLILDWFLGAFFPYLALPLHGSLSLYLCDRYALLVGQPPFETDTLKETYSRITSNKYVIPPLISEPARHLIRWFLHPDPNARPRFDQLLNHEFFTSGML